MKKILFLILVLFGFTNFNSQAKDYKAYVKSDKHSYKTGLLFRDPRLNPKARRVLRVYPAKGAVDYKKMKATSCDNSGFLPPVGSQGAQNCCTAWAVGYYFKSYQENKENNRTDASQRADANNICSPAFIYNLIHVEDDGGSYFDDGFYVLNTLGCSSLAEMPFDDSDYTTWPSKSAFIDAMKKKTVTPSNGYNENYIELDGDADLDSLKQLLLNGNVVVFGISVYDNYYNISDYNNIYALADKTGTDHGGHAQCIVGFDDTKETPDGTGAFKVVNSWGPDWGDNGFYWISYEAIKYGSDYSFGYVMWVDDRNNYNPSYYAVLNITHPYSRETQPYFITSTGNRLDFFDFYVNQSNYELMPYPSTDIAIDLTDISPQNADYITFYIKDIEDVTNGQGGTINKFAYVNVSTGDETYSYDTPVDFADNSTGQATVYFSGNDYTITASAGDGGTINPSGDVVVHEGMSKTFTFVPDPDFHVVDVKVDGQSQGQMSSYTFTNVTSDHTIEVLFEHDQTEYTITASASEGGSIDPSGDVSVLTGEDQSFLITPEEGYYINDVTVDSKSVGRVSEYTFHSVHSSHTIHAKFTTSLPPEILSATVVFRSGTSPIKANFTCQANDPDGGNIVKYIWEIDGDNEDKVVTYTNSCEYTFTKAGSYNVKVTVVDDEGETATANVKDNSGNDAVLVVSRPSDLKIPIMFINGSSTKSSDIKKTTQVMLNPFLVSVNLKIIFYDSDMRQISTVNKMLTPMSKFVFNPDDYDVSGYTDVLIEADNYLIVFNKTELENGLATAYSLPNYTGNLYIPHIAEEVDYWNTDISLLNLSPSSSDNIKVDVDNNEFSLSSPHYYSLIDAEQYLSDSVDESRTWGTIKTASSNPFEDSPKSLSGFELFVHNGTDGAATELVPEGHTTLFIPHIPEETSIFWTGFAIVNTEDSKANLSFDFYSDSGELVAEKSLTVDAKSKLKGTMQTLFPDVVGRAKWGIIHSDREIIGIEIYGTNDAAICGYNLPSIATAQGILPFVITGEDNWSGIVITNPSNESENVAIQLFSKDGTIKVEKTVTLESMHRFKAVVSDFFSDTTIEDGDYIKYISSNSVVAIVVNGDKNRTFMSALTGIE